MNASRATVILFEMAELWARVMDLPGVEVATSSEKARFDRMAAEFPAMAQVAKLLQAAGFDYVNGMAGFDALAGDLQANADTLATLICRSAPTVVRAGMSPADPLDAPAQEAVFRCVDSLGNVAFVRHTPARGWACTLANGIPAAMSYAGVPHNEETATVVALGRAKTVRDALNVMKARAQQARSVELEA